MSELFAWYNIVFYIALAAALLMVVGVVLGIGVDSDADHDVEHDVSVDVDHGLELGADHDADHDMDHGAEHDHEARGGSPLDTSSGQGRSLLVRFLSVAGVGKVPLTYLLLLLFLIFGGIGFVSNTLLAPLLVSPWIYFWISLALAIFGMIFFTGKLAKLVNKYMPSTETYAPTKMDLIGTRGEVAIRTTSEFGVAQIYDNRGNLHRITCKTSSGEFPQGHNIIVVDYNNETDFYTVETDPVATLEEN
ncbi:YqiJ family protein [Patescibacteria group bacterium]|nr:YqiJ family protein [Patescibacteria group bacterium]